MAPVEPAAPHPCGARVGFVPGPLVGAERCWPVQGRFQAGWVVSDIWGTWCRNSLNRYSGPIMSGAGPKLTVVAWPEMWTNQPFVDARRP